MANYKAQVRDEIGLNDGSIVTERRIQYNLSRLWADTEIVNLVKQYGAKWTLLLMRRSYYRQGDDGYNETIDGRLLNFERGLQSSVRLPKDNKMGTSTRPPIIGILETMGKS